MTLAAGMNSDDDQGGKPGTGLAPVAEHAGIDQFLAKTSEPEASPPRSWRMRIFDYSAHAAMIAGLIGFAWTVSDHVVHRPTTPSSGAPTAGETATAPHGMATGSARIKPEYANPDASPASITAAKAGPSRPDATTAALSKTGRGQPDELAELRRTNARMAEDIKALRADLASLGRTVGQNQTREQIHALAATVDGINSGLASAKTETSAALAQLASKVDRMQRDARTQSTDIGTTGSLPQKAAPAVEAKIAPLPPVKPARLAALEEKPSQEGPRDAARENQPQKAATIPGWTVLDVYEGVALVEGKRGPMEVMPGVTIPGAGVVRSIDRSGGGWTVTTSKGVIAFGAPGRYARRINARESYRGYRYDF